MIDTPLINALKAYAEKGYYRFHMPGHKGLLSSVDFTELDETGNLYTEKTGAIRRSEELTARYYNAEGAMYLTGGATQGIFSMLAYAAPPGSTVALDRCCHKSVIHAAALLDLRPVYLERDVVDGFGIADGLKIEKIPENASCVLVTSPTYYGVVSDLASLRKTVGNVSFLVDGAHGAHLKNFSSDIAVYSAHKTLSALGQTAFLLYDKNVDSERLRVMTSVTGTSSPSYVLLSSLDYARAALNKDRDKWEKVTAFAGALREKYNCVLSDKDLKYGTIDPCRLCLKVKNGFETAEKWKNERNIVCEMVNRHSVVLILTSSDSEEALEALERAVSAEEECCCAEALKRAAAAGDGCCYAEALEIPRGEAVLTLREALFAPREEIPVKKAAGRIAAECAGAYPPGVPVLCPGERVGEAHIEILAAFYETINVVK